MLVRSSPNCADARHVPGWPRLVRLLGSPPDYHWLSPTLQKRRPEDALTPAPKSRPFPQRVIGEWHSRFKLNVDMSCAIRGATEAPRYGRKIEWVRQAFDGWALRQGMDPMSPRVGITRARLGPPPYRRPDSVKRLAGGRR